MTDLRKRRGLTVRAWLASIAALAVALAVGDAIWLAPHRRELRSVARLVALGGRATLIDGTPSVLKRLGIDWFDFRFASVLDLDGSRVADADLALLADCPRLVAVFLRDTAITDAGLVHLRKLHIGRIDLSRTRISNPDVETFPDVYYGLQNLDLSGNRLRGLKFGGILLYLNSLDLAGTGIDDATLDALLATTSLYELDLSGTNITDAGVDRVLARLDNLAWVNLAGTKVTAEGIAGLHQRRSKATRPTLTVVLTPGVKGKFMDFPRPPPRDGLGP